MASAGVGSEAALGKKQQEAAKSLFVYYVGPGGIGAAPGEDPKQSVSEDEIRSLFGYVGKIRHFAKQYDAKRNLGGYEVVYEHHVDAFAAVQHLSDIELKSGRIKVENAVFTFDPTTLKSKTEEKNAKDAKQPNQRRKHNPNEIPPWDASPLLPHNHLVPNHGLDPLLIPFLQKHPAATTTTATTSAAATEGGASAATAPKTLLNEVAKMQEALFILDQAVKAAKAELEDVSNQTTKQLELNQAKQKEKEMTWILQKHPSYHFQPRLDRTVICRNVGQQSTGLTLATIALKLTEAFGPIVHLKAEPAGSTTTTKYMSRPAATTNGKPEETPTGVVSGGENLLFEFADLEAADKARMVLIDETLAPTTAPPAAAGVLTTMGLHHNKKERHQANQDADKLTKLQEKERQRLINVERKKLGPLCSFDGLLGHWCAPETVSLKRPFIMPGDLAAVAGGIIPPQLKMAVHVELHRALGPNSENPSSHF